MHRRLRPALLALFLATASVSIPASAQEQNTASLQADEKAAFDQLLQQAESGNADAQLSLALLYQSGNVVEKDDTAATGWFRRAAKQNNPVAQYNLGLAYAEGKGIDRDPSKARLWIQRAANQKYEDAINWLKTH